MWHQTPLGFPLLLAVCVLCGLDNKPTVHGKNLKGPARCKIGCLLDDYYPLCGTDNKTYGNDCLLYLKNNCENPSLTKIHKAYDGECIFGQQGCEISCTGLGYMFNPICGTDGKTYDNDCELDGRNKCDGTKIEIAYQGECQLSHQESSPLL